VKAPAVAGEEQVEMRFKANAE